jgi:demethylmenaquinone methyltransferase/2-methoxy-6-polyprenyl-1,4-benzoquinol methylase
MTDIDAYIQRLLEANPLREPLLRSAIQGLRLRPGSLGIDVGCGIGLQALLLAEAVGSRGHITGMDIIPEFLACAEDLAAQAGLSERLTFQEGDMSRLPFAEGSFDWAWSADCAGYPAGDLAPVLEELVRVVRPGGSVIILGWSSQQVLPGYPLLEARLNAACSAYLPFLQGKAPELHFLRALRSFREAGLEEIEAQTFAGDIRSPLSTPERLALTSLFEMLWAAPQNPSQDWIEYQKLCRPDSPDFILDQPDYYAFFTYTMFRGKVSSL